MRVLIYQQFHPGHHYRFLHYLLPSLAALSSDIVLALTPEGRASEEFRRLLEPHSALVRFDPTLPPGLDRVKKQQTWQLHTDLRDAVRKHGPDYVLVPSGDANTGAMGFYRYAGLGALPGRPPGELGVHWGRGTGAAGFKERLKDIADHIKLQAAGWDRVHIVNLLFYDAVQARGGGLARRSVLMPMPVERHTVRPIAEARRRLGIPEDARVVGMAGDIDRRKAVAELLAAFRAMAGRPTDRVLLAGTLHPTHRETIARDYSDLVKSGQLVLLDRFLNEADYRDAFAAVDVMAAVYPGFTAASQVVLESLAVGKPVLTNALGWCKEIVERFGAGWTCRIGDPQDVTRALARAFAECDSYVPNEATSRLLAFNSPENFAASWLQRLSRAANRPVSEVRTWAWVMDAVRERQARAGG